MQTLPDTLCYLNGQYGPLRDAKVSVLDRGFIFGDGVYEVLPVYGRKLFRFDEHMARLNRSLAKLRIGNPLSEAQWLECCRTLIASLAEKTGAPDQLVCAVYSVDSGRILNIGRAVEQSLGQSRQRRRGIRV